MPDVSHSATIRTLPINREFGLAAITLVTLVAIALAFPPFATAANLREAFDDTSILILLALGQMLVLLTRAVDLSVAANVAFSGMCVALFNQAMPNASIIWVLALAIATGTALGAFNGLLVWLLKIPSIVVTLGTMAIYRGLVFVLSHGAWVTSNEMSTVFQSAIRTRVLGFTVLSWLAIVGFLTMLLLLRFTSFGRRFYLAGDNPSAAAYVGVNVGRVQFAAFTLCGAVAGLCGYLWVSRFAVAYTDVALGFELQVIAACVIGGVSIAGGVGTVVGVLLGCLFLGAIKNALPLIGISPFWQMAVSGLIITLAVAINARRERASVRQILEVERV
jgi:rhamnose transport system permease protein